VVRRWAFPAALLSALTAGGLALLCLRLPLDRTALVLGQEVAFGQPVVVLGQTLMVDSFGQLWLAFVFGLAAVCYLFAWRVSQGRSFFAFSLVMLSLYSLTTLLQSFSLAVITFAISATLAVFIIQAGQRGSTRGAQRYLLVTLLAVPLLLVGGLTMEPSPLGPDNAELIDLALETAAPLALLAVALGFGLLLAAFPFGTWIPAVATDAPPIVSAFLFTAGHTMGLFLVLLFLRDASPALNIASTPEVLQLVGLVMVVAGGLMAAVQRDFGRLFGYAVLSDSGYLLMALGSSSQALTLTLLHAVNRAVSINLLAASLAILRHQARTDRFRALCGAARQLPVAATGIALGLLALAGFPLTAGFATHWSVCRAVASEQWAWTLIMLASSAGIVVGLLRGLGSMMDGETSITLTRQPLAASMMVLILGALVIILGLHPQLFLDPVQSAVKAFSLF
jgi:NADH-quinone oxidoreductase subunit N